MYLKKIILILSILFSVKNLFSQEVNFMEIEAKYFRFIERTYNNLESLNIDLSEYKIGLLVKNNILYITYIKPDSETKSRFGSPPKYPSFVFEIDIKTGEIISFRSIR